MKYQYIKDKVRLIKEFYPGFSALDLLKNMKVVTGPLHKEILVELLGKNDIPENTDGCYLRINNVKFVFVHPDLEDNKKNEVYTHELGHVIFHPYENAFKLASYDDVYVDKLELEANIFAAEFLLDDDIFDTYYGWSKYDIAKQMCVSVQLVDLKRKYLMKEYKLAK